MDTAFYDFVIPGMGHELSHFQSQIKSQHSFPSGTRIKRVGTDLVFGATFREIYPELKTAMTKFIYKLGADVRIDLDGAHSAFVKKSVRLNTQKNKHLEWIMPYGSVGIICTMTHDSNMKCIYIGAFSYLHRLHNAMIDEANCFKESIVDAITKMDSKLLDCVKRQIRNTKYPSCFDNVVFVQEEEDVEAITANSKPVAVVATVRMNKRASMSYEPALSSIQEQPQIESISHYDDERFCWVCDKTMSSCTCN